MDGGFSQGGQVTAQGGRDKCFPFPEENLALCSSTIVQFPRFVYLSTCVCLQFFIYIAKNPVDMLEICEILFHNKCAADLNFISLSR